MCRMFCLSGNYSKVYKEIVNSFLEITRSDPLSMDKNGVLTSHDHGWGFVHYDDSSLEFLRSKVPVFESNVPYFNSGEFVIHARKAAPSEPIGTLESHPHIEIDEDYEVYLAHNGWFDKQAIAKELNIDNFKKYVDSQLFLKYIFSFNGGFKTRLENALAEAWEKNLVKSTANLMILSIDRNTRESKIFYYTDVKEGHEYSDYVRLYQVNTEQWRGVFSSSIIKSRSFPKNTSPMEVEREIVHTL